MWVYCKYHRVVPEDRRDFMQRGAYSQESFVLSLSILCGLIRRTKATSFTFQGPFSGCIYSAVQRDTKYHDHISGILTQTSSI